MDIHKPKPWHSFREFLKEYLIIVVGVLTALGAEAMVENLHERRLSAEAREAVRAELNVNITNLARRHQWEPCVKRRLDELEALVDRAEANGGALGPAANIAGPQIQITYTQRWQAATAGGRTSLLSSEEQRAFGRVYAELVDIDAREQDERDAWHRLHGLGRVRRLTPDAIYDQRLALSLARDGDATFLREMGVAQQYAGMVGVKGDAKLTLSISDQKGGAPAICLPLNPLQPTSSGTSPEAAHGHP